MVKNQDPDPGRISRIGSYFRELITIFEVKIIEFFDAYPDPGSFWQGLGMEKFGSGINIRNTGKITKIFVFLYKETMVIFSSCCFRFLEQENPRLGEMAVLFTLQSPLGPVIPVKESTQVTRS
jgi:hypothetical protein